MPKPNAGPPVTPYHPLSHPAQPKPKARPHSSSPSVSQVTAALAQVAGLGGQLLWEAIDLVFNFSGMWHDVQTIMDPNANWWAKAGAVADLGFTIFTDINMLDGEGEAARAAEVGGEILEKGTADVVDKGLTDAADQGLGDVADCALSFSPRTPVATDHGKQAIVSLHPGDKVWAYNPATGKMELQPILHVWLNHDNDLVDLTITTQTHPPLKPGQHNEVVHTTQKHPFLTIEKGFLPVGQIKLGMHVLRADGSVGVITGWKLVPGSATMYNLEVAQDHTYTVGDGLWVVHNCAGGGGKLTPPEHPDGMNRNEFGKNVMKWGSGDAAVRDRIATVTREEMEQGGVTKDMAKKWRDFYRGVMVKTPENPSAAGRADLMQHVFQLLGGTN